MADKTESIQILFTKRNARKGGPTNSDHWNDTIEELAHDLNEFVDQWNNRLVPLLDTVPDGSDDVNVDAFANGLSGRHLYTDADATATINTTYWDSTNSRPMSILEQFDNVYNSITDVQDTLEEQISIQIPTASQVSIADAGGIYDANNVEDALTEVKTSVDLLVSDSGPLFNPSALLPTSTTQTIDWSTGTAQVLDLGSATGDVTITLSNGIAGTTYIIRVIQDATTPRDLVWPASVKWPDGITPVISVGASAVDIVSLFYDGTNYWNTIGQNFS